MESEKRLPTWQEMLKDEIETRMEIFDGNKIHTAKSLGLTSKTLYNWLHKFGLMEKHRKHRSMQRRGKNAAKSGNTNQMRETGSQDAKECLSEIDSRGPDEIGKCHERDQDNGGRVGNPSGIYPVCKAAVYVHGL